MTSHAIKGMKDLFPPESALWVEVESVARELFGRYAYEEIRTPLVEDKALFARTLGEATAVVEKEMYDFQDKKGKWIALRPEGTAGVVRAFIEKGLAVSEPTSRFFYFGPMFRYEQPQQGRYRQFHQIGVEVFGLTSPLVDAEVIHMADLFFKKLGLEGVMLELNSLGCPLCRPKFLAVFTEFLKKVESSLCEECHRRTKQNPLRALDCKNEGCLRITAEAPSIQDHLCDACEQQFDHVLEGLGALGTSYRINARIVRGLDYYLRTTFEFTTTELGAQNAIAGGGRYDGLVHLLGGPNIAGFGFAIGMERLMELVIKKRGEVQTAGAPRPHSVFIAPLGEKGLREGFKLAQKLRDQGLVVGMDYEGKSLKSAMRRADRIGASHTLILGEDELKKSVVLVKEMAGGAQKEVPLAKISKESFKA
ncbi:MAG: histidine--tRNA ligase [Deltaproteobacteria bacterium]|nr:histidine--tRNA ligase [Deltaproteobacteria bacterium]